ncbi:hypothetical protein [uncultured Pseudoxanthomonas sp.]|uniref:hypothetical protein n=1 Tax=uncultured Pseudoxanthomonas sp. TaxID=281701 RepID=UPI0026212CCA|nr:hypothetical protein [uncultured Pseudoxanthomonas sp.]
MNGDGSIAVSRVELCANRGDKLHDLQLLHDLAIIDARTVAEMGPLPAGGFPVVPKRRPNLPGSISAVSPSARADHQENETMDLKCMAVAASMALAACAPAQDTSTSAEGGEDKPLRKLNPNPKQAYVITMKVEGAPGPFAVVRGVAQYDVENAPECGRYLKFAGVYPDMTSMESFPLTRVSDTEYEGRVYFDLLLDEDYFGRGVCRWKFMQAQVALKATGGKQETEFLPYLRAKAVQAEESQTRYFWKGRYPRSQTENFPSFGQEDRAKFARGISDDDLFIIKLTSRKVRP